MPMIIRDRDLRGAVMEYETRPGDQLWSLLVDFQQRRDAESDESTAESPSGDANEGSVDPGGGLPPHVRYKGRRPMGKLDRRVDRLLDDVSREQWEEGPSLDPSRLDTDELVEVEGLLRVGTGLPRLTLVQQAEREAREEGRRSHMVPHREIREDDRAMERSDFDPDRLSPKERERLGDLFEKIGAEG